MFGITKNDIDSIDKKIEFQKQYLENFSVDYVDKSINMLDNTYSTNLTTEYLSKLST
ncbi:MAG: hypothetical protein U9Q33_00965 [Campylobacterota bacterium]|nr:hypothetical protein [Campylobacterota bacterium]